MSSIIWGQNIFDKSSDMAKLNSAENFLNDLDQRIQNIIKFGGQDSLDYNIGATIEILDPNTIEMRSKFSVNIPNEWINISSGYSVISEKFDGTTLRMQLYYPQNQITPYLYTDGPRVASPQKVYIEKDSTFTKNDKTYIRVKITFK